MIGEIRFEGISGIFKMRSVANKNLSKDRCKKTFDLCEKLIHFASNEEKGRR